MYICIWLAWDCVEFYLNAVSSLRYAERARWWCDIVLCQPKNLPKMWRSCRCLSEFLWLGSKRSVRHNVLPMSLRRSLPQASMCWRWKSRLHCPVEKAYCNGDVSGDDCWGRCFSGPAVQEFLLLISCES